MCVPPEQLSLSESSPKRAPLSLARIFSRLGTKRPAMWQPPRSLIAFKACNDLGLGPHPIHQVEQFDSTCVCANNGSLQGARCHGGAILTQNKNQREDNRKSMNKKFSVRDVSGIVGILAMTIVALGMSAPSLHAQAPAAGSSGAGAARGGHEGQNRRSVLQKNRSAQRHSGRPSSSRHGIHHHRAWSWLRLLPRDRPF